MRSQSRSRERRRGTRYTGVLYGPQGRPGAEAERPVVQHGARGQRRSFIGWRLVSLALALALGAILALFFTVDVFYVRSISVGGLRYLTKEEVFAYADIAGMHLFWIDPDRVRDSILRSAAVADAQVVLGWPPNMVQVTIAEREPALVWEAGGVATWVDLRGRIMAQREDRPGLIRVVAEMEAFGGAGPADLQISIDIVHGALQLQELLPPGTVLRYHPVMGLGYKNENGWDVWFGTGTDMPQKMLIYQALADNLRARGIQPGEINVRNPNAPVYSVLWGR